MPQILAYNRANRAVAILCNHQRAVPKTFDKSMENLMKKIADKKEALEDAEKAYKVGREVSFNVMLTLYIGLTGIFLSWSF